MALVVDGFVSLMGGVHSGVSPEVLSATAFSRGVNLSCRGGLLKTRPGFVKANSSLPSGTHQGTGVWSLSSGDRLVVVISGQVCVYDIGANSVSNLGVLLDTSAQCYMEQADRFFVIQDGSTDPVILEEVAGAPTVKTLSALAKPDPNDPTTWTVPMWPGTAMAFVHGRLHMVPQYIPHTTDNGRPYFISGDITLPNDPSSCLYFQETEYLNGGGAHGLPQEMGYINALSSFRNSATGTGYGALLVFAKRGVCAFDPSLPRAEWSDQQLGQVLFFGPGTISPWSVATVNNDVVYRSDDGLRFINYTRGQIGGNGVLSNVSQSSEVDAYLLDEDSASLPYVSTAFANNRMLSTCDGQGTRYFTGAVILDLAISSAFRGAASPAYFGVWQIEGERLAALATAYRNNSPTLFAVTDELAIWYLDEDAILDDSSRIKSRVQTRSFVFNESSAIDFKRIAFVELGLRNMQHDVDITVYFRPSGFPLWNTLGTRHIDVPAGSYSQRRRKIRITPTAATRDLCDPSVKELLLFGQRIEFALEFTGSVEVEFFRAVANVETDPRKDIEDETATDPITLANGVELGEYL